MTELLSEMPGPSESREIFVPLRDGHRLRLHERGAGAPVLLLHGFTGSVEAWGEAILGGLARRGFRVLAPDLPGHGRSDIPEAPERYRLEEVLRDLEEVLEAQGVERAHWVGYSMGGRLALGGAALRPGRVRRLVLESASPGLGHSGDREARRARDEDLAARILEKGIESFVEDWMALPLFESQRRLPETVRARERQRRLAASPLGLANTLRGLGTGSQPSFWDRLSDMVPPTLLLAGSLDEKYVEITARMARSIHGSRHRVVPGAGHAVHLEAPGPWLEAVADFLAPSREEV